MIVFRLSLRCPRAFAAIFLCLPMSSCFLDPGPDGDCDIEKQINFLPFGPEIVGSWRQVREDGKSGGGIEFDQEGHLVDEEFGCGHGLYPVVVGGFNVRIAFGRQVLRLNEFVVRRGYFKMSGSYTHEGELLEDGRLKITSGSKDANFIFPSGIYVKEPSDE